MIGNVEDMKRTWKQTKQPLSEKTTVKNALSTILGKGVLGYRELKRRLNKLFGFVFIYLVLLKVIFFWPSYIQKCVFLFFSRLLKQILVYKVHHSHSWEVPLPNAYVITFEGVSQVDMKSANIFLKRNTADVNALTGHWKIIGDGCFACWVLLKQALNLFLWASLA